MSVNELEHVSVTELDELLVSELGDELAIGWERELDAVLANALGGRSVH